MDAEGRARRVRSFVFGGLVGASAVLAAARGARRRSRRRGAPAGLAAFEGAPCFREHLEAGGSELPGDAARPPESPPL